MLRPMVKPRAPAVHRIRPGTRRTLAHRNVDNDIVSTSTMSRRWLCWPVTPIAGPTRHLWGAPNSDELSKGETVVRTRDHSIRPRPGDVALPHRGRRRSKHLWAFWQLGPQKVSAGLGCCVPEACRCRRAQGLVDSLVFWPAVSPPAEHCLA